MGQRYIEEWKLSDNIGLIAFLDGLDDECWKELLTDYVEEKEAVLFQLLAPSRHDSVYDRLLFLWEQLPKESKDCMTRCLNELLPVYKERHDERALMSIIHVAIYLELPLCETELKDIAASDSWGIEMRQRAIVALSACKRFDLKNFWASIDLEHNPFFLPAYIAFNQFISPLDGLKKLDVLDAQPENLEEYELPVKNSLVNILRHPSWMRGLENWMKNDYAKWTKAYMEEMIDSYEVLSMLKWEKTSPVALTSISSPLSLNIGISVFPDLMVIDYMEKVLNYFVKYNLSVNIKYIKWGEIFDALDDEKDQIDVIFANKGICWDKIKIKPEKYFYHFDLNKNDGLKLIAKKYIDGKAFSVFPSRKNFLKYFQKKKWCIAVERNTDAYAIFARMVENEGLLIDEFNLMELKENETAFETFEKNDKIGFYIGNMICIDEDKYTIIYSAEDFRKMSIYSYNGCISLNKYDIKKDQAILALKKAIWEFNIDEYIDKICDWFYIKNENKRISKQKTKQKVHKYIEFKKTCLA